MEAFLAATAAETDVVVDALDSMAGLLAKIKEDTWDDTVSVAAGESFVARRRAKAAAAARRRSVWGV